MDDQQQMRSMMSQMASAFAIAHGHRKTVYSLDSELSPAMKDLVQLLEMAIAFARNTPGAATAQIAALAGQVEGIPACWPGARYGCIEFLDRTVAMLPAIQAAGVWPFLLRLRETR